MNPRVSVVTAAYNLAEYLPRAIDSALSQIAPGGAVEVIVVDDGSADETPEVIAGYGDRIRSVRQENAGTNTAIDRGIGLASGEYIALLDADDEWPEDRLQRHVAALDANPQLGMVHGDMEVIDANGAITEPSYFSTLSEPVPTGRMLGSLLGGNYVSGGASTFRSVLRPAFHPMVPDAAYHDWTIASCIACVAEIGLVEGIANRYRFRGGNDSLGRAPGEMARVQRRELPWRRWMFRHLLDDPSVTADHLRRAYVALRFGLISASSSEHGGPRALLEADLAAAESVLRKLPPASVGAKRSKALLRALAEDPFDGAVALELELALNTESAAPALPAGDLLINLNTRGRVVLGWLDEVTKRPGLLQAFAGEYAGEDATLVVLAPPAADLQPLVRIFEHDPALASEDCDVTVITEPQTAPGRAWLAAQATSHLSLLTHEGAFAAVNPDTALERVDTPARAAARMRTAEPAVTRAPRRAAGDPLELTIVIPTLDSGAERVAECVSALRACTNVAYQVVIIDNGTPPQGFTAPVNAGVRAANSPYVVVMNDDVEVLPGWWEPLRAALRDGAAVAVPITIGGQMRHDFAAWCFAMTDDTIERFSVSPDEFFDPELVVWYQDTDLLERLREAGAPPVQVDESHVRHLESQTVATGDRLLRGWIDGRILEDERHFRAKHPHVGDVTTDWSYT